jgi:hypothetical protein
MVEAGSETLVVEAVNEVVAISVGSAVADASGSEVEVGMLDSGASVGSTGRDAVAVGSTEAASDEAKVGT